MNNIFIDDLSAADMAVLMSAAGWQNRYKILLGWGKLISYKETIRVAENKVKGCALDTWLVHDLREGLHCFSIDSDSRVVKGLAVLLLLHINARSADEIRDLDIEALMQKLELQKHLSSSRGNGFKALLTKALDSL